MRILVVGCGSIGTRRAKILAKMGHKVYGLDPAWDRERWLAWYAEVGAQGSVAGERIPEGWGIDAALICTPPDSDRLGQVKELATSKVKGLFVEKPLAMTQQAVERIAKAVQTPYAVPTTMGACNLRFSEGIDVLRSVEGETKLAHFQQGLHSKYWNPNHKPVSMILDAIHYLDLAHWLLGPIESIRGVSDEGGATVSVHHQQGHWSTIMLDRCADPPRRRIEVGDARNVLESVEHIIDTDPSMYVREMQHFMDCVEVGIATCNPIEDAAEVCRWALEVA